MSDELEPFAIGSVAAVRDEVRAQRPVEHLPPGIWVPVRDGRGAGQMVGLHALTGVDLDQLAHALGLELEDLLDQVDTWSQGLGFTYGVRVDREAQTITQAGR